MPKEKLIDKANIYIGTVPSAVPTEWVYPFFLHWIRIYALKLTFIPFPTYYQDEFIG